MKIAIKNLHVKAPVDRTKLRRVIREVFLSQKVYRRGEITVCFVSDAVITKLSARYLKRHAPTDVIAFNLSDSAQPFQLVADVLVSVETALRNAKVFGTTAGYEACLYAVHGALHLLGYDDKTPAQRKRMQQMAEHYLKKLDIKI